jgi:phosphoglycolate phosphatase-like HAD superfamily hydrolase
MTKGNIASEIIIKNRCNKHETLFIGDALSDYNAARINGIQFIARTRGDVDIFKEVDCRKISDFSNFLNIVREL